jgi:hypothetical protein
MSIRNGINGYYMKCTKLSLKDVPRKIHPIGWYEGELWFFDNYIIPLVKKLETCGVFGVSCGELLDYARDNRAEWAAKGKEIVAENLNIISHHVRTSIGGGDTKFLERSFG